MGVNLLTVEPDSAPQPEPSARPSPLDVALANVMDRRHAARGAIVTLVRGQVRVSAALPDVDWLRSVDLYIARALLNRNAEPGEPLVSASDRTYVTMRVAQRPAVFILGAA